MDNFAFSQLPLTYKIQNETEQCIVGIVQLILKKSAPGTSRSTKIYDQRKEMEENSVINQQVIF